MRRQRTWAREDEGNLAAYRIVCTLGYHDLAQVPCPLMSRSDLHSTLPTQLWRATEQRKKACVF